MVTIYRSQMVTNGHKWSQIVTTPDSATPPASPGGHNHKIITRPTTSHQTLHRHTQMVASGHKIAKNKHPRLPVVTNDHKIAPSPPPAHPDAVKWSQIRTQPSTGTPRPSQRLPVVTNGHKSHPARRHRIQAVTHGHKIAPSPIQAPPGVTNGHKNLTRPNTDAFLWSQTVTKSHMARGRHVQAVTHDHMITKSHQAQYHRLPVVTNGHKIAPGPMPAPCLRSQTVTKSHPARRRRVQAVANGHKIAPGPIPAPACGHKQSQLRTQPAATASRGSQTVTNLHQAQYQRLPVVTKCHKIAPSPPPAHPGGQTWKQKSQ